MVILFSHSYLQNLFLEKSLFISSLISQFVKLRLKLKFIFAMNLKRSIWIWVIKNAIKMILPWLRIASSITNEFHSNAVNETSY